MDQASPKTKESNGHAFIVALCATIAVILAVFFLGVVLVDYGKITYPILYGIVGFAAVISFYWSFTSAVTKGSKDSGATGSADVQVLARLAGLWSSAANGATAAPPVAKTGSTDEHVHSKTAVVTEKQEEEIDKSQDTGVEQIP